MVKFISKKRKNSSFPKKKVWYDSLLELIGNYFNLQSCRIGASYRIIHECKRKKKYFFILHLCFKRVFKLLALQKTYKSWKVLFQNLRLLFLRASKITRDIGKCIFSAQLSFWRQSYKIPFVLKLVGNFMTIEWFVISKFKKVRCQGD